MCECASGCVVTDLINDAVTEQVCVVLVPEAASRGRQSSMSQTESSLFRALSVSESQFSV